MSAGFQVADRVVITGGKYKGNYGIVMKLSSKMVVVRLDGVNSDVRVYQYHVEKGSGVRTLENDDKNFRQCGRNDRDVELTKVKLELALLRTRVEELTLVLAKLELDP